MRFSEGHWAVFVRRSPLGGPWTIEIPGVGHAEQAELTDVVPCVRGLLSEHLGREIAELANEQLNIWVQWEAVLETIERGK